MTQESSFDKEREESSLLQDEKCYEGDVEEGKDKQRSRQNSAENLLKDGMCYACSRNEPINCSEIVKCFFCQSKFHAINCSDTCNVSAPTAFTNHLSHAVNKTSSSAVVRCM